MMNKFYHCIQVISSYNKNFLFFKNTLYIKNWYIKYKFTKNIFDGGKDVYTK